VLAADLEPEAVLVVKAAVPEALVGPVAAPVVKAEAPEALAVGPVPVAAE
jgi:hypothetical protein